MEFLLVYLSAYFITLLMIHRFQTDRIAVWGGSEFLPILAASLLIVYAAPIRIYNQMLKEKFSFLRRKYSSTKIAITLIGINSLFIYYPQLNEFLSIFLILIVCYCLLSTRVFQISTPLFIIYYWGIYHFLLFKEWQAIMAEPFYYLQFQLLNTLNPLIFGLLLVVIIYIPKEKSMS